MTEITLNEYWRSTLRPDALAQRRAMSDAAHLYALPGILAIAVPNKPSDLQENDQDEYTEDLPLRQPTGSLS